MISTDREILLDIQAEQAKQRQEFSEFKAVVLKRLDNVEYEQRLLHSKVDGLQTSMYWGFALMGLIVALLSLWLSSPRVKQRTSESQQESQSTHPQTLQPILIQIPPSAYEPKPHSEKSA